MAPGRSLSSTAMCVEQWQSLRGGLQLCRLNPGVLCRREEQHDRGSKVESQVWGRHLDHAWSNEMVSRGSN
jgi:hypothetical protein